MATIASRARMGVAIPQIFIDGRVDPALIRASARLAEDLGFDSLWTQEQLLGKATSLEPTTLMAYAAAVTLRVRLGVSVYVVPRHDPVRLAKEIATVDQLSSGRFIVGVGLGGVGTGGVDTPARRLAEGLRLMRALWTTDDVSFDGRAYAVKNATMNPKPHQQPIPVWFGGRAPSALERAAKHGDGWMGAGGSSIADFKAMAPEVRRLAAAALKPGFVISKRQYVAIDDNPAHAARRALDWFTAYYGNADLGRKVVAWGTRETVRERIEELVDAGAQHLLLAPMYGFEEHYRALAEVTGLRAVA
ncbi:MAG: LLM class flavin-dependent oxidoreductase [SAR202 cluster bacterium]|nr:LLM class flavin-dependent oxidoreductase [SAR202 cluster bacterium]